VENLPLASVFPLIADKVDPMELGVGTNAKFTIRSLTATPKPFVTVAVRMLFCPVAKEDGVATNTIFNPADVVFGAVLVMTTAPEEL
jgi:hypothetical protein